MENIIQTENLSCRFGKTVAVDALNLAVPQGSIFALLGSNGAGKTTTIKMLMNIIRPSGGRAHVLGKDSVRLKAADFAGIGYVSENQKLPEWMTVAQFIAYCRPFYPTWDDEFCARLGRQFDLPMDRKLKSLSRGMKVKAALLTSLAYRPRLLVLDEPFTGLDPLVRDEFTHGVLELSEQESWTVLVSSHDIEEVERLADRVGMMSEGKLQFNESVETLQARFRRVEFSVPRADPPPMELPVDWVRVESAAHGMQIIVSHYEKGAVEQEIRQWWPGASEPVVTPLSLREIFVELSRRSRNSR